MNPNKIKSFKFLKYKNKIKEKIEIENQWKSLVYAKYSSSLKVDTESLKKQIENTSKENFLLEYNLSEIVLTKKNDLSMDDLINEVQESIKNVGFENTAILYSISDSSKTGGKIGWIKKNNLSKKFPKAPPNKIINEYFLNRD